MKLLKTITILFLSATLVFALALPARAASGIQSTRFDDNPISGIDASIIYLTDTMYFDTNTREYVYPVLDSGTVVRASVADGMIVTTPVKIVGATLLIYKDGELWEGDATNITEPGEYVVMAQTGSQTPRLFVFTLVGGATSIVYSYNLPSGMIVLTATRDGESTEFDGTSVPMQEDGLYHVEYEGVSTEMIYTLDLNVDRTPPEIQFDGKIDENHRVHSALEFSGLQKSDTLQVTLDGVPISVNVNPDGTGELVDSGSYVITVYDEAGNSTVYGYIIMLYLNSGSLAFFIILGIALVALGVYIFIRRKQLRIG